MPLSNINVDRILSDQEVRQMLLEDAVKEDEGIAEITKQWKDYLKLYWRSKEFCNRQADKIPVKAWKEEGTYIFSVQGEKRLIYKQSLCGEAYGYQCITEMSYLTAMPRNSQLEGISIAEIEEICNSFYLKGSPIKCLLDAGFTLNLIVPRNFLGL